MSEINKKMFSPSDKTSVAYHTMLFPVDRTEVNNLINKMLKYKLLKQLDTMSYKKKYNPKDDAISEAMVILIDMIIKQYGSGNYGVEFEGCPFNEDIEYNMNATDIRKGGKYFSSFKGCGHRTYIIEKVKEFVEKSPSWYYGLLSKLCQHSRDGETFDILYRMVDLQAYNQVPYSKDYIIHIFEKNTTKQEREEISTEWFETSKKPTIPQDFIKKYSQVYICDDKKFNSKDELDEYLDNLSDGVDEYLAKQDEYLQENEYQEIDDKIDEYIMNLDDYTPVEELPPPVEELTSEECEEDKNIVVNQEAVKNIGDIDGKRYYSNVDFIDMAQYDELEEKKSYYREKIDKMRETGENYTEDKYIKYTKKYCKYLKYINEWVEKHPVKWYNEDDKKMWKNW
tara:strand:- start:565 stop:1755 length:1191 start_codon:yes stop_codon:yes gene_type:complete